MKKSNIANFLEIANHRARGSATGTQGTSITYIVYVVP